MVLSLLVQIAAAGAPVELQQGVEYAAGTRVQSTDLGVSFEIPAGWKGGWPPGAEAMLLASDTHAGAVLVTAEPNVSVEQAKALLAQPMPIDAATVLKPAGAPTVTGKDIRQRYTHASLVGHARGRVTDRAGILFLAVGPTTDDERIASLADTLIASVQTVAAPDPGPLADALRGKQIYYLKADNGFSDEWHAYLCSDGTAIWSGQSSGMSTGGVGTLTMASESSDRGTWTVQGTSLHIRWADGSSKTLPLRTSGGSVKIDLSNHWVQPQDACP